MTQPNSNSEQPIGKEKQFDSQTQIQSKLSGLKNNLIQSDSYLEQVSENINDLTQPNSNSEQTIGEEKRFDTVKLKFRTNNQGRKTI